MTTLVDAAVKPNVSRYVANIHQRLDEFVDSSEKLPFYIMKSNGGVLSADEVVHQPITTVLSGPAAGALGAGLIASRAGFDKVLTCDGGGTSTDVSVVLGGEPTLTTEGSVGAYPSKIPMIDVVTVGAGGGSIAWISPEGSLKVGPQSAGADPGPLCYAKGGTEPTITDAHVTLGRIPPHLLGGEIPLDVDAARAGIKSLAERLDLDFERCATGILEISAWNQANALRQVSVKRGLDVRDFMLATFGGSGSLLACRLVDILDLAGVVVPQNPGNVSAFGLLTVDVRNDYVQTSVARHDALDLAAVRGTFDELTARAASALDAEGFDRADHRYARTVDLRYFGQAFEVRVPAPEGDVTAEWADAVADAFHAGHRALYGYDFRADPRQRVEWVNLRVTGIGPIRRPTLRPLTGEGEEPPGVPDPPGPAPGPPVGGTLQPEPPAGAPHPHLPAGVLRPGSPAGGAPEREGSRPGERERGVVHTPTPAATPGPSPAGSRPACFDPSRGFVDTAIYRRDDLAPGDLVAGPAVVEEYGATVPLLPGFRAEVDRFGNLIVTRREGP
jgi:N-methylhydantoinase A